MAPAAPYKAQITKHEKKSEEFIARMEEILQDDLSFPREDSELDNYLTEQGRRLSDADVRRLETAAQGMKDKLAKLEAISEQAEDESIESYTETALDFIMRVEELVADAKWHIDQVKQRREELETGRQQLNATIRKVLGLQWSTSTDKIVLECAMELDDIITKRSVLKTHAKVFDPLGFLTPLTVKSKLFIQGLWPKNYGWDEQLSTDDRAVWKKVINAISGFRREIPRGICAIADKATLITFSDASGMAQAACAYLKCSDGPTHLIMSRSKVIGKFKEGTMPKLELDSFMIAIRMAKTICDESKLKCDIKRIVMFSDSKIALSWIKAEEAPHRAGAMRSVMLTPNMETIASDTDEDDYRPAHERHRFQSRNQAFDALRKSTNIVEQFWKKWSELYLINLRDYYALRQGKTTNREPEQGEIVLLIEDDLPRNAWMLGLIEAVIRGKDDSQERGKSQ
ncbi:hypothetical protein QR680_016207 [Steinernema hermaphroditum]|uniref:DUF5641 domain-containing protein n=1 Tax=Steinernema hermaphroditum TaxID=289476 RepID=A0AA39LLY6_9BILA|nr:hypothetical protein QR680_016207 [Steinernema hermaphroditum]